MDDYTTVKVDEDDLGHNENAPINPFNGSDIPRRPSFRRRTIGLILLFILVILVIWSFVYTSFMTQKSSTSSNGKLIPALPIAGVDQIRRNRHYEKEKHFQWFNGESRLGDGSFISIGSDTISINHVFSTDKILLARVTEIVDVFLINSGF
jgi:hypothetical protein